ncbi:LuxR C-terminal-related transcriptional regulator [Nocardia sp. NPDC004711]
MASLLDRLNFGGGVLGDPELVAAAPETHELLSATECRVAVLAAGGRTNREIATELYITASTVEQHRFMSIASSRSKAAMIWRRICPRPDCSPSSGWVNGARPDHSGSHPMSMISSVAGAAGPLS